MESAYACRAGVDVQAAERRVVLHLQDMRMSGNEEGGARGKQFRADGGIVAPRITADVRHHHLHALHLEVRHAWVHHPDLLPVDVPVDGAEGFHRGELVSQDDGANVARVPNLVAFAEVFRVFFIPITVGVG